MSSAEAAIKPLGQRVMSGTAWSAIARLVIQFSNLAAATIVARRVPPSAYGIVGMAVLVTGLVWLFRDLGITSAVIQKRDLSPQLLSSLFWVSLGLGIGTTSVCFLIAPVVAAFFHEPLVTPVLRVLSISFLISSVASIHNALMTRDMRFRQLAFIEITSAMASLALVIALAILRYGVWALASGVIVTALVSTAMLVSWCRWRPLLHLSWRELRSVMNFGLNLSAFNVFNYFARNADNTIIGRYLGSAPLGYYQLAYNIMLFPIFGIAGLAARVLFPAFSEIQNDHERFRRVYIRACCSIAFITFPLMAGAAVLAGPLIRVFYGPQWGPVVPVLMILAPVGLIQSVVNLVGQIYTAKGRTGLMFKIGAITSCVFVLSFVIGLPWGIRGVATAYAIATLLLLYPALAIPFRLIELRGRDWMRALAPIVGSTMAMVIVVAGARVAIRAHFELPPIADLLAFTALGAVAYMIIIFVYRPAALEDVLEMVSLSWPASRRFIAVLPGGKTSAQAAAANEPR